MANLLQKTPRLRSPLWFIVTQCAWIVPCVALGCSDADDASEDDESAVADDDDGASDDSANEDDSPDTSDDATDDDSAGDDASNDDASDDDGSGAPDSGGGDDDSGTPDSGGDDSDGGNVTVDNPLVAPEDGPAAGWAEGGCDIPAEGGLEDVSNPTTVVGDGTPESCTGSAFIDAVANGGVITFNCGDAPHTITLTEEAKIYNNASDAVVIDGGGLITLSGGGTTRILYMNTCDEALVWTTPMCNDQDHPRLTVQNITFADGSTANLPLEVDGKQNELASVAAVYASGGRFKAVNTRWFNNHCLEVGQDLGGGALRVMAQYQRQPVYIVNSTFGGQEGYGNSSSNGGAISSIHVNWNIYNSLFSYNSATGNGGNPAEADTPGGGSGGAIYNDGVDLTLNICGSLIENNTVNAYGEAIFFVSNNKVGSVNLTDSVIRNNCGGSWEVSVPSISHHPETPVNVDNSEVTDCE